MSQPAPPPAEVPTAPPYPPEVVFVDLGERRLILVGTAHVSRESVELVRRVITAEAPDRVAVELDRERFEALSSEHRWESLDLKQILRRKQLPTLLVSLLLASYQRRLGRELGVEPGTELLEATRAAEELGVPVELVDRSVRVTLRRAARATPWWKKSWILAYVLVGLFDTTEISEEELRQLKQQDVLSELLADLGRLLPALKRVLIDERDAYLAERLRRSSGRRVVAVVGAGHLEGIRRRLAEDEAVDLAPLEEIPPPSRVWKVIGWGIPAVIVGSIAWIGWTQGGAMAGRNALYWFLVNGILTAVGALLAFAHPLTVAAGFVAAPFTSLTPVIGAGYVTALVQAYLRPPQVRELKSVVDDVGSLRRWWGNKMLRIFLAFLLPSIGSALGTWIAGTEIVRNLFAK